MKTNPRAYQYKQQDNATATEAAIALVEANNSPDPFKYAYDDALKLLVDLPEAVTSDTVFPDLERYSFSDGRVVGPLMRKLVAEGKLALTNLYRPSSRKGNHGTPRRVYKNLTTPPFCLNY